MEWMKRVRQSIVKGWDRLIIGFKSRNFIEEDVLVGIDIDLEGLYDDPNVAVEVQQRYMSAIKQIDLIRPKYKLVVEQITLLQRIEMLSSRAKQELEKLCLIYSETLVKKGEFREKIKTQKATTNRGAYLEQYEDNMEKIIEMMEGHEEHQRIVKQDLAYLESEKSELLYQNRRLKKAYTFVKSAFVVVALLTAIAAFVLSIMYFVNNLPILTPAMIAMVAVIGATVWVYVFRRYLRFELNKNQKLMKRAIELINKTKIKYINNQKVIDYQCGKYKVDSSEMLRLRWENYNNKVLAERQYVNISNSIAAMITDIEDLLHKNGINDNGFVLDYMDYFTSKKGRKILLQRLNEKKEELMITLKRTEKESQVLNLVLVNYKSHVASERSRK